MSFGGLLQIVALVAHGSKSPRFCFFTQEGEAITSPPTLHAGHTQRAKCYSLRHDGQPAYLFLENKLGNVRGGRYDHRFSVESVACVANASSVFFFFCGPPTTSRRRLGAVHRYTVLGHYPFHGNDMLQPRKNCNQTPTTILCTIHPAATKESTNCQAGCP